MHLVRMKYDYVAWRYGMLSEQVFLQIVWKDLKVLCLCWDLGFKCNPLYIQFVKK